MAGYTNVNDPIYWNSPGDVPKNQNFYDTEMEFTALPNQQLDFQSFGESSQDNQQFYQPNMHHNVDKSFAPSAQYPEMFTPMTGDFQQDNPQLNEYDEPPLLEELEIYPDRIMEKTLAVLNPFRSHGLADDAEFLAKDTDLAGPVAFCLILAVCLFLSGNRAPFGYIYGLSVVSCLLMYALLTLMTSTNGVFTLSSVASVLGYCLLPVVALSVIGIFISLRSSLGILLAFVAVVWSSLSASRLFVAMSGDSEQRPLIAYPCALVCGVFALLVIF